MKRVFLVAVIFFIFLILPLSAFSQTEVIYPEIPGAGLTPQRMIEEARSESEILPLFMDYMFRLLLIVSVLSVVIIISYAGVLYMLSSGNPEKTKIAREWILSAMQGLFIIFISYTLLFAIDSRFVLFELRDLDDIDTIDPVDLDWEIKNIYYQVPFGLLIEDAILNEEAEKKFYDVYDATLRAEAVAEAIYQGSVQLMQLVERGAAACPVGLECAGQGPAPNILGSNIPFADHQPISPSRQTEFPSQEAAPPPSEENSSEPEEEDLPETPPTGEDTSTDEIIELGNNLRDDHRRDYSEEEIAKIMSNYLDRLEEEEWEDIMEGLERIEKRMIEEGYPQEEIDERIDEAIREIYKSNWERRIGMIEEHAKIVKDTLREEGLSEEEIREELKKIEKKQGTTATDKGSVSSEYGWRDNPYSGYHHGIDVGERYVDSYDITPVAPGEIIEITYRGDRGYTLRVEHKFVIDGKVTIVEGVYQHLDDKAGFPFKEGDFVTPDDKIGTMGETGYSTAKHLHLEFHKAELDENGNPTRRFQKVKTDEPPDSDFNSHLIDPAKIMDLEKLYSKSLEISTLTLIYSKKERGFLETFLNIFNTKEVLALEGRNIEDYNNAYLEDDIRAELGEQHPDLVGYSDDFDWLFNPETGDMIFIAKEGTEVPDYLREQENIERFIEFLELDGVTEEVLIAEQLGEDDEEETDESTDDDNEDDEEEPEKEPASWCGSCPDIRSPILAKVGEIEGYMAQLPSRLNALEDTKEPLLIDLYQLYKAVMIKSLGSRQIFGYNSFLLERRYYEREEVIIETDRERIQVGPYTWDWRKWIENTLYRVEIEGEVIEENDPVTFYLRKPDAEGVIEDALELARNAQTENIQDAGERVGVERRFPAPPPDIGTTLYPPVSPNPIRITSPFGERYDPFTGDWVMHYGIDFAGPKNTPIYASENGEVVFADWAGSNDTGYGKLIVVYHRKEENEDLNQDIVTYYAHLNQGSFRVEKGDRVRRGDHIAGMGTTGRSTGYHLHYEVRVNVSSPYQMATGKQVDPAPYIDTSRWGKLKERYYLSFLQNLLNKISIRDVSALTDLEVLNNYLNENNLEAGNLSLEELEEILRELGIESDDPVETFDPRSVEVKTPSDYLTCGMEIPVGETFELTWEHLVEILDTIDNYIAEGERLLEQQARMNSLASACDCPCGGAPTEDCPGQCQLNCNVGAIRTAHQDVVQTRNAMRQLAEYLILLTDGHFNTPTEDLCYYLNEDIRDDEEKILCDGGGSKLITKHELITRKLNYSRIEFDECITRPEHLEDTLGGVRTGKIPLFGPLVEEENLPRYTKTENDGVNINTSDFNWFCCSDSRIDN